MINAGLPLPLTMNKMKTVDDESTFLQIDIFISVFL